MPDERSGVDHRRRDVRSCSWAHSRNPGFVVAVLFLSPRRAVDPQADTAIRISFASAIRAFERGIHSIGGGLELLLQIVQRGPGFGDIRSPFSLEPFKLGVGRGVTGEIFFDQARDGPQRRTTFFTVRPMWTGDPG